MFCNPSLLGNANSNDTTTPFMKGHNALAITVLKQIPASKSIAIVLVSIQGKVECNLLVVLVSPYGSVERLADTESNTDSDTHDEKDDQPLDNPPVALAKLGHAGAAVLCLCGLGLLFPVIFSRPNLAVGLAGGEGGARCLVHA